MRSILSVFILVFSFTWTSCEPPIYCDEPITGCDGATMTLRDYEGLDGCGWVLTDGNEVYEPINLGDFNIPLHDGSTVTVDFEMAEGMVSICMVGPLIEITCIETVPN